MAARCCGKRRTVESACSPCRDSNGLATTLAYNEAGDPARVLTGLLAVPDETGVIADPLHVLDLDWTVGALRRAITSEDLESLVTRVRYDEVGHLETGHDGIDGQSFDHAAVDRVDAELQAILGDELPVSPLQLRQHQQVNAADELRQLVRHERGGEVDVSPTGFSERHQPGAMPSTTLTWSQNGPLERREVRADDGTLLEDWRYTHDWMDRLVAVEHGSVENRLLVDPFGRLVAKVTEPGRPDEVARVYVPRWGPGGGRVRQGARRRRDAARAAPPLGSVDRRPGGGGGGPGRRRGGGRDPVAGHRPGGERPPADRRQRADRRADHLPARWHPAVLGARRDRAGRGASGAVRR